MVEAAGIEPASVTGSPETSTCLVACYLTRGEARRHATPKASAHLNFAPIPETGIGTRHRLRRPIDSRSVTPSCRDELPLVRQPVRSYFRHLMVFPPFYEMDGISACSLRSPDHVETRSPPSGNPDQEFGTELYW